MEKIIFYDTSLRDGMQGMGINYTLMDKLQIVRQLDEFGIDYIEGGFPLSNRKEADFFRRLREETPLRNARLSAFGSTCKPQEKAESDSQINSLLEAGTPTVTVVGKACPEHVRQILKASLEENLRMVSDSLLALKRAGREVIFDLEHFFDGYKRDPGYALEVLKAGSSAGADCLVLCDTNGGTMPAEVRRILAKLPQSALAPLGVHFHNDTGNAVANSLAGIEAGAIHVQGTINGWGERCGNANLCVLIPNVCLKLGRDSNAGHNLRHLTSLSRFVAEKANLIPDKHQPYVGEAAFCHKAGQHADVILKAPELMEHISGELVGNERRIILSELAGKSTVARKLAKYGRFDKSSSVVASLTARLKELEAEGYEYEAAEASFDLVMRRTLDRFTPLLILKEYRLESFKSGDSPAKSVGRILLETADGKNLMGAAVGLGPVEALDGALRDALLPLHQFLKRLKLTDYAVRVLNPEQATAARVRVFITTTDGEQTWDTVGVSENIVEASWQALVDSMDYYYNNFVMESSIEG